jgi:phosphate transport system permease protein
MTLHFPPTTDPTVEVPTMGLIDDPRTTEDRPRALRPRSTDDLSSVIGTAVGSLALVWIVYFDVLPLSGVLGFIVCWYFAFLAMYAGVTALAHPRTVVVDRLMGAIVALAALLVGFALLTVVVYTFGKGGPALIHLNFFKETGAGVGPLTPLNRGGIWNAIAGSCIQLAIAVAVSLPLGLGTAIFMTEVGGWFAKMVRTVVEAMTAVPDLLAGLFVYVTLILQFHMEKDGLAAAIALSVTMTPIIARSAEVALRVVPGGLREAGLALGASHWTTVRRIVLPTARPGLATALILAVARGVGESAPLLIVSGLNTFWNSNPLKGPMNSLPLYIFAGARSGQNVEITRAFGAASVLLALVFLLFIVTRVLARHRVGRR